MLSLLGPSPALLVLEGPLGESWAAGGSARPGRSCRKEEGKTQHDWSLTPTPRTSFMGHPCPSARLTWLTTCLSVPGGTGDSRGSGLAVVLGGLAGGLGLLGASAGEPWAPAGSGGGSGETGVGELSGEAGELGLPPPGALSRSVTVVTSWLLTSGVGVGSRTSAVCCSSCSGTCGGPMKDLIKSAQTAKAALTFCGAGRQVPRAGHAKHKGWARLPGDTPARAPAP